jgi:hypothetical protein
MTTAQPEKPNGHYQPASSKPATSASDAELIARLDSSRNQLMQAAGLLREPLHAVARAERVARNILPVLPYAVAAITVIGVAGSLLSGRRVRPVLLIATGLDVWRLWKSYKLTASMPAVPPPRLQSIGTRAGSTDGGINK